MALIGWYPLDGNTEDYTVNQNHGVNNGVTWVDGKIGQAGSFNGSSSYITANYSQVQIKAFSLWVKVTSIPSTNQIIFIDSASNVGIGFYSGNSFILSSGIGNTNRQRRSDLSNFIVGEWNHIYVEYDELLIPTIYINKLEPNYLSNNVWSTSGNEFNIGRRSNGVYFLGELNDVRIYDHALSQKEINDLAKAKVLHYTFNKDEDVVYDSSGYKRNGGKVGTPAVSTDNALGSSSMLVGLGNNAISFPSNHNLNIREAITINIWLKRTTDFNQNQDMFLVSRNPSWYFYDSYASGAIRGDVFIDSVRQGGVTTSLPFDGNWYMITYTYDSNLRKSSIYKNGVLDNQKTLSGLSNYLIDASTANFSTCGSHALGRGMLVDDVQIYATALSESDILDLYQTRIKIDKQGNIYANEIVEDYEVKPGLTLRELFEDNNLLINGDFNSGMFSSWSTENTNNKEVINGVGVLRSGDVYSTFRLVQNFNTPPEGHKMYLAFNLLSEKNIRSKQFQLSSTQNGYISFYDDNNINTGITSNLSTFPTTDKTTSRLQINFSHLSQYIGGLAEIKIDDIIYLDSTEIFGLGSEPSEEQLTIWYKDYITSRPKSSGIVKTREFSEIDSPEQPLKIFKDKIQIQGSIKEG